MNIVLGAHQHLLEVVILVHMENTKTILLMVEYLVVYHVGWGGLRKIHMVAFPGFTVYVLMAMRSPIGPVGGSGAKNDGLVAQVLNGHLAPQIDYNIYLI
jgi:hypothetical protein